MARTGVTNAIRPWLNLAVFIAAILVVGGLLSSSLALVTNEEGRRAECEASGGRWMSEFDYIVEAEGRVPGVSEDVSFTESCY